VSGSTIASVTALALHPNYPATPTVWVGTDFAGMYFSASGRRQLDRAERWPCREQHPRAGDVPRCVHAPHVRRLWRCLRAIAGAVPRQQQRPGHGSFTRGAVEYRLNAFQIRSVTIDPTTKAGGIGSTRLYATGRCRQSGQPGPRNGGIYRSLDGGYIVEHDRYRLADTGAPPARLSARCAIWCWIRIRARRARAAGAAVHQRSAADPVRHLQRSHHHRSRCSSA
jgi:hypothetical protein